MGHPHIRGLSEWRPLARGGLALVWQARQDLLARLVAVKVYQDSTAADDASAFVREAAAAGRLSDHPGIVTAYDGGILADNRPYLIMELCPGGSLTSWLSSEIRPTEDRVRLVGVQLADALAAAHACGVIHRDVKPANVLIDTFGHPRLADFGLATLDGTEPAAKDVPRLTPAYAPPEAFTPRQPSEAGDVFSLGATLYALLTGSPPRRVDATAGLEQILEAARRPITAIPGVNWFLMDTLMSALDNDPKARPTAVELRTQLSSVPASRPRRRGHVVAAAGIGRSPAADDAAGEVIALTARRRRAPRRAGLLAMAAALVAVAIPGAVWLANDPASSQVPTAISAPRGGSSSTGGTTQSAAPTAPQTPTGPAAGQDDSIDPAPDTIRLVAPVQSAQPFQTLPLRGTYRGGADTFVRVQRWENGTWHAFPVPAKTGRTGEFTAYVELAQPRRYRLRVVDPQSGVTSEPFVVVVRR